MLEKPSGSIPQDVVDYLLADPERIERVRRHATAEEDNAKWIAECAELKKNAKIVPCGAYGCKNSKWDTDVFCEDCYSEYLDDPEAFK